MRKPYRLSRLSAIAGALLGLAGMQALHAGPNDTVWTRLFNGVDMKDWDVKIMGYALNADPKHHWRVADSAIEVNYSEVPNWNGEPWSHAEYKLRPYSYYLLKVDYQFYGTQVPGAPGYAEENSGIMVHSQKLSTMALNQNWPISLENQLLGPKSTQGPGSANLCTPGTAVHNADGSLNNNHCINAVASNRTVAPLWTRSTTLVLGDSVIKHFIEGKPALTYFKPVQYEGIVSNNTVKIVNNARLTSGYIQLQSESAPIRFRNLVLTNLEGCMTKGDIGYKSYYLKHDPAACGIDPNPVTTFSAVPGTAHSGPWAFQAATRRLHVDLAGAYGVELRRLDGTVAWKEQGRDRKEYDLASLGANGVFILVLNQAGRSGAFKVVL